MALTNKQKVLTRRIITNIPLHNGESLQHRITQSGWRRRSHRRLRHGYPTGYNLYPTSGRGRVHYRRYSVVQRRLRWQVGRGQRRTERYALNTVGQTLSGCSDWRRMWRVRNWVWQDGFVDVSEAPLSVAVAWNKNFWINSLKIK